MAATVLVCNVVEVVLEAVEAATAGDGCVGRTKGVWVAFGVGVLVPKMSSANIFWSLEAVPSRMEAAWAA